MSDRVEGSDYVARSAPDSPLLVYDGDCGFCRLWVKRWRSLTQDRVRYAPFQEVASQFPEIPIEAFRKSVQLILPGGEVLSAAHAVFQILGFVPGKRWPLWMYWHIPGAASVSEWAYRVVAGHRRFFSRLTETLWGAHFESPSYALTRWLFLRLLGVVYFIAFISIWWQIPGLVGSNGILPSSYFLQLVKENFGHDRYWLFPTLAWMKASDSFLQFLALSGALLSLLLILGLAAVPALTLLWINYLSLVTIGQDFMAFQWDILLLETGFLAIFFAPHQIFPNLSRESGPSRTVLWLFRLLLFRLMFSSGAIKLLSGDATWRNLTALNFHYETQPLPTPMAWSVHQLPVWMHKASVVGIFFAELFTPFLIFTPRRVRFFAAGAMIVSQLVIGLTGNYTFFNLLTIALCLLLLDDAFLSRWLPKSLGRKAMGSEHRGESRFKTLLVAPLAVVIVLLGALQIADLFVGGRLPQPALKLMSWVSPLHLVNRYGLFAVMTTSRPEIIVEGSMDGEHWLPYEFKYKPGDLRRRPPWVEPHQPRLDWQMWFAALGSYESNRWFVYFMLRLLQGSPQVLALLDKNPFPHGPPRYARALLYDYHFTDRPMKRSNGTWWRRELKGSYFPIASLK